jgi:tetratricopeptide (TPR) repeat protein
MTRENLLFAVIGILFGFIVGFMFASTMNQRSPQVAAGAADNRNLPSDHPQVPSGDPKNPQQVFADVQQAIGKAKSEPNNFDAQIKAAELYYQIQRHEQAIEYLLKANQLKPDSYEAIVALGQVNLDAKHFDQAEKWFKAALLKKPEDLRVWASLTFALIEKGDADAAAKSLAAMEKLDSTNEALPELRQKLAGLKSPEKPK